MKQSVVTALIRRILLTAGAVAGLGLIAALLLYFLSQSTLAFGQKCGGGQCWGYQIKQYQITKRTVLIINATWGLHLEYELPRMLLERANEDRWLAADRALYLNFRLKPQDDPNATGSHLQVLYDFQRGEMYVSSPFQLWRGADYQSGDPGRNWLTEEDFQAVVQHIEP